MNLNQLTIFTNKPLETVEFYERLGLTLIVDSRPRYARLLCPDGDSTLSVHEDRSDRVGSGIVIYFECEDLDFKVSELKYLGLQFDEDPTDKEWLWREAYLNDPAGNRVCLFYAGENRINPPWRVGENAE
ncbi:MAG: VOC family protein [Pyrinomonadaceae bacterium]|nr:VOC family protein [Pyrinomonadaceae bacterium]